MNEELTDVPREAQGSEPVESSSPPEQLSRLSRRRQIELGAVLALALAAGITAWVVWGPQSSPAPPRVSPLAPVALSASGLKTLAAAVGQPIFWAGPRRHYLYELKRTPDGNVHVRYLPPGVNAGAAGDQYMIITTIPFRGALATLRRVSGGRGIPLPGGGLASVDRKRPTSVYLAFPKLDYQVKVYDPSPAKALTVASSGQVRPAR